MKKLIKKYYIEIFAVLFSICLFFLAYSVLNYKYEKYEIGAIYRHYDSYYGENPFKKNYTDYIMLDYKDGFVKMKNIETGEIYADEDSDFNLTKIEK